MYSTVQWVAAVFIKGTNNNWEVVQTDMSSEDKEFAKACYLAAEKTQNDFPEIKKIIRMFEI